ncbi:HAD hydrolase family protein [Bacillus sp. AK031]
MPFYIFDVDGVLTDEHARPSKEVLHMIEELHKQNEQIAMITGRSRKWLQENILSALNQHQDWSTLFCVAEHGAIKGIGPDIAKWNLDKQFIVQEEIKEKLRDISQKSQYKGLIEWDGTKESMGTVESVHGNPGDKEHLKQTRQALKEYAAEAKEVAGRYNKKVILSTYGVDVIPPDLSKKIGAEWVFDQASPGESPVYVFGDSPGDLVMAETAVSCGVRNAAFYWVGEGDSPESDTMKIETKSSSAPYAEGTKEFLSLLLK